MCGGGEYTATVEELRLREQCGSSARRPLSRREVRHRGSRGIMPLLLKCTQWRVLQCLLYTYVPPSSFSSPLSSLLYNASEESLRRAATSHLTLEEEDDHHHHHRQQLATSARSGRVRKSTHSKQVLISNQRLLGMCALPALVATASGADSILQLVTTTDRQRLSMAKSGGVYVRRQRQRQCVAPR